MHAARLHRRLLGGASGDTTPLTDMRTARTVADIARRGSTGPSARLRRRRRRCKPVATTGMLAVWKL